MKGCVCFRPGSKGMIGRLREQPGRHHIRGCDLFTLPVPVITTAAELEAMEHSRWFITAEGRAVLAEVLQEDRDQPPH